MLVKRGTLIDATIIEAQARRPQSEAGARSGTDPDAAWTRKGKRGRFGYKMHIGMDAGSGLIRGGQGRRRPFLADLGGRIACSGGAELLIGPIRGLCKGLLWGEGDTGFPP